MTNIETQVFTNVRSQVDFNNNETTGDSASLSSTKLSGSSLKKSKNSNNKLFLDLLLRSNNKQSDIKKDESIGLNNKNNHARSGAIPHDLNKFSNHPYGLDVKGKIADDIHSVAINKQNTTKQMVGYKDRNKSDVELCAFSIYKLSYIDQLSGRNSDVKMAVQEISFNDGRLHLNTVKEQSESSANELVRFGVVGQDVINKYLNDLEIVDEPTQRVIAEQATLYEKYKISIIGEEQNTMIIRDYANSLEINVDDIKNIIKKSPKSFTTVILNGKEV